MVDCWGVQFIHVSSPQHGHGRPACRIVSSADVTLILCYSNVSFPFDHKIPMGTYLILSHAAQLG